MPRIYKEARFSCECGSEKIGPDYYDGEEHGLWKCADCGFCDYPEEFDRPKGFIDDECSTCQKETVYKILAIDNWDGEALFCCSECQTSEEYKITAPYEFEKKA